MSTICRHLRARRVVPCVAFAVLALGVGCSTAAAKALSHDVNGDGLADVALPDLLDSIDAAGATVAFGARDRSPPPSLAGPQARGFRILDPDAGIAEAEVIGDVNGDKLADILVTTTGQIFVVYGKRDVFSVPLQPRTAFLDGTAGVTLEADETFATGAGDINGDGLADLIHVREGKRSVARVLLGSRSAPLRRGFDIITGGRVRQFIRSQLAAAGDLNGDGRDDIALAVVDPDGRQDGFDVEEVVYVVWGKRDRRRVTLTHGRSTRSARVRVGSRPGGFVVAHARRNCACSADQFGAAGDLNGDGRGDLAVVWGDFRRSSRSRLDVVFGRRGSTVVTLDGGRSSAGAAVPRADTFTAFGAFGDLTADRRDDLLLGLDRAAGASEDAGASGLFLLSGARVRRPAPIPAGATPLIIVPEGLLGLATPAGDVDGDGRQDLLLGWAGTGLPTYAVLYGAMALRTVNLAQPGTAATVYPR